MAMMNTAIKPVLCITLNPALDMTISVSHLQLGEVNRATAQQIDAAGKGLNAAQIIADLGIDTVAAGFLGANNSERFDCLFREHAKLATAGCMSDAFVRVAGETRTNIKLVDGGVTTDINGQGFHVTAEDKQALLSGLAALAKEASAVLVAGSLPKGFDLDDFDTLLSMLTKHNHKVAVDVSGAALAIAIRHPLWLIKPNSDELTESFGVPAETLALQMSLFSDLFMDRKPISHVLISMGEAGVHWLDYSASNTPKISIAKPPKVLVKSTVGAGDTLVAGMIFGLLTKLPEAQLLAHAVALSAHAVSIIGFGVPDRSRLDDLMAGVHISVG